MKRDGKELIEMENEIKRLREDNRALQIELDSRHMMIERIKQSDVNEKSSQLEEKVFKMEQKLTNQAKDHQENEIRLKSVISSLQRQIKEATLKVEIANKSAMKAASERDSKSEEIKDLRYLLKKSQNALQSLNLKECDMKVAHKLLECPENFPQPGISPRSHELKQQSMRDTKKWPCSASDNSNTKQFISTQILEKYPKLSNQTPRLEKRFSTENCHTNHPTAYTTESCFKRQLPNHAQAPDERQFVGYQNIDRTYPQTEHGDVIPSRCTFRNELTTNYHTHKLATCRISHSSETHFTAENAEIKNLLTDILNKLCSGYIEERSTDLNKFIVEDLSNVKDECLTKNMNENHQEPCSIHKESNVVLCQGKSHIENNIIGMKIQDSQIPYDNPNQSEPILLVQRKDHDKVRKIKTKTLPLNDKISLIDIQNDNCPTDKNKHLSARKDIKDENEADHNPHSINEDREINQIKSPEMDFCVGKTNIIVENPGVNDIMSAEVPIEITVSSGNAAGKSLTDVKSPEPNTAKSTVAYDESIKEIASEANNETSDLESDSESKLKGNLFSPQEVSSELFERQYNTNQGNDTGCSKEAKRSQLEE